MSHYKFYLPCYSMRYREENEMDDFAERVLFICDYLGITPYQVWKKTNLSKSAFYRSISSSSKNLRLSNFLEIVDALGVPVDFFEMSMDELRETLLIVNYRRMDDKEKQELWDYLYSLSEE